MNSSPRYCAVVPAAGSGRRFGGELPKQYLQLHGRTVLEHTIALLLSVPRLQRIVLVVHPDDTRWQGLGLIDPRLDSHLGRVFANLHLSWRIQESAAPAMSRLAHRSGGVSRSAVIGQAATSEEAAWARREARRVCRFAMV